MKNALAMEPTSVPMPKMRGRKSADANNRGELECIQIDVAENGFEIVCRFEPKNVDPKIDRYNQMPEPEKKVFESTDSALAYLKGMMNGQTNYEAEEEKPAKPGKSEK